MEVENGSNETTVIHGETLYIYIFFRFKQFQQNFVSSKDTPGIYQEGYIALVTFVLGISLMAQTVKHLPTMWETQVRSLGREDPLQKEMATQSSALAWKITQTEEPGRLQPRESQKVGHD